MNTLEELLYYCNEPEPVGALLLTGEWGCGKTYLIDHALKEKLKDKAFLLRISLFGLSSLEEIHAAVKQAWMEAYCKNKGMNDATMERAQKGKEFVTKLDFLPDWIKGVASTNWTSFVEIGRMIGDKSVILVFDDLERCKIDCVDVLGSINDYCENKKFHTIIVANQDKIQISSEASQIDAEIEFIDNQKNRRDTPENKQAVIKLKVPPKAESGTITYPEIKEKIIQRTIKYMPDYPAIVHTVIDEMKYEETECGKCYKIFVKKCEKGLLELFSPEKGYLEKHTGNSNNGVNQSTKNNNAILCHERPHNIRSLKCAINDFYRVYKILIENEFPNVDRWFYSFTSYMIAYKAGIAKDGIYGTILTDQEVRMLYPVFQNQYMFTAVKKWILHGVWDQDALKCEIEIIKECERAKTPTDIVRTNRIIDIEEEIVYEGFPAVLEMAYTGRLSLDDYVQFIRNCCWARTYGFTLPLIINWEDVKTGIKICINSLISIHPEGQQLHSIIEKDNKKDLTEDEWSAYQIIDEFQNGNVLMFSNNRKLYIDGMNTDAFTSFIACQNKRFDMFNEEMALATADAYARSNNQDKCQFPGYFEGLWDSNLTLPDIKIKESIAGFQKLLILLKEQKIHLQNSNKAFAVKHTDVFIQIVTELLEKAEKMNGFKEK